MQDNEELDKLIALYSNSIEGKIWRGSHTKQDTQHNRKSINTGHDTINAQLHNRGWPLGTINEFGLKQHGIGELRLLLPALKELQGVLPEATIQTRSRQKQVILIAPPYLPFSSALNKENIDLESLTIVKTETLKDSLWATEQSLSANCCAAVICWTGTHKIHNNDLRRLQLASEKSQSWGVLFRHSRCLEESSVAGLRIQLNCSNFGKLELDILKQPQGWGGQKCTVSLAPHYENWQRLPTNLLPVHIPSYTAKTKQVKTDNTFVSPIIEGENVTHPKAWHASVSVIAPLSALRTVH